jgi:hypothetical protein
MGVKIEIPTEVLEPLFNALNLLKPNQLTRLEKQSIGLLKSAIYFELELMMETEEERAEREIDFKKFFKEQRAKMTEQEIKQETEEQQAATFEDTFEIPEFVRRKPIGRK